MWFCVFFIIDFKIWIILKYYNSLIFIVPTQKMARMVYSSASAMRKFQKKAECMGVDTHALEFQDAQVILQ